jgi:hypothetical protein
MAKLDGEFSFTGPLGGLSAYKRRDVDGVILRRKGGPTARQIKEDESFDNLRRHNAEFGGRATSAKYVRKAIWPVNNLANYNYTAQLIKICGSIMMMDSISEYGKRNFIFTKNPQVFSGFNLNRDVLFDSIIRHPIPGIISRETFSASIEIPPLLPGINFFVPGKHSLFSVIASLGWLPDMVYNGEGYSPMEKTIGNTSMAQAVTAWQPVFNASPAATLELTLPPDKIFNRGSLLLSVGIRFGLFIGKDSIVQEPRAGAAKILMAV